MRAQVGTPAAAALLTGLAGLAACGTGGDDRQRTLLVTTTTVEASGLLEALVSAYHAAQDSFRLSITAVGSGAALAIGGRGDADLLVTHDPIGEAEFMAAGHGAAQGPLMRNEFIVVGPPEDPAGIRGMTDLAAALEAIAVGAERGARSGAGAGTGNEAARGAAEAGEPAVRFVSRGDDSGTHRRERQLLRRVGRAPWVDRPGWYIESGTGMDETLRIADQRGAYALSGRSTYLHLRDTFRLAALARGDPPEVNAYQWTLPIEPPNPAAARHLRDWLVGPGQDVVARYGVEEFGEPLFIPTAGEAAGDTAAGPPRLVPDTIRGPDPGAFPGGPPGPGG